ncbi:hypothetical protein QVD17_16247 [Tagetes erecta]|uniref:Uncharacterized protein n=1 Tax=Tagetes erecta TaxID=13708 RepID=A0AAD8KQK3_TARER|nr:hypothetical protein QVD17_16247 [Tagetes erecta]
MIRLMRRGGRKVWWLITHKKRSRRELKLDMNELRRAELATIDEDLETFELHNNGPEKHRKYGKTGKKTKKEEMGRVFNTRYSVKNSYALFLDRMTSTRSFGGLKTY